MSDLPAPPSLPPRARNAAPRAIVLTSHPPPAGQVVPLRWGATDPAQRGPVIATLHNPDVRNVIGTHAGAYALYRALAIAAGQLAPDHRPDRDAERHGEEGVGDGDDALEIESVEA